MVKGQTYTIYFVKNVGLTPGFDPVYHCSPVREITGRHFDPVHLFWGLAFIILYFYNMRDIF